jgi:hypothetical protein
MILEVYETTRTHDPATGTQAPIACEARAAARCQRLNGGLSTNVLQAYYKANMPTVGLPWH